MQTFIQHHKNTKQTPEVTSPRRTVIIAGCSRLGAELALHLDTAGFPVIMIDTDKSALDQVDRSFGGILFQGEATDPEILRKCAIDQAELLFSVFDDDATNLLVGRVSDTIFHVPEVQIRLENGSNRSMLTGTGIMVICPPEIMAAHILHQLKKSEVKN